MKRPPLDPRQTVRAGYDRIAGAYRSWATGLDDRARERHSAALAAMLAPGARVLDLGCGAGRPVTSAPAEGHRLVGVDLSRVQLRLARGGMPDAELIEADMTRLAFAPASFDAVCSFYAFGHLPRHELPPLLRAVAGLLKPGGALVASFAISDTAGAVEPDWLGAPMFFSSYDRATTEAAVRAAGFAIGSTEVATHDEFGRAVTFLWVVARAPAVARP